MIDPQLLPQLNAAARQSVTIGGQIYPGTYSTHDEIEFFSPRGMSLYFSTELTESQTCLSVP